MATSSNAMIKIETSNVEYENVEMIDSGDHLVFNVTDVDEWSGDPSPEVKPNGITEGWYLLTSHVDDNKVTIATFKAYSEGIEYEVAATTATITRPATDVAKINSITMTDAGAISVVVGTDGATQTFSETRGAAGGPPLIPKDSVELGQVRVILSGDDVIDANTEIKQVPGQHAEYADLPIVAVISNIGEGKRALSASKRTSYVEMASALPLIHDDSGAVTKSIYITYRIPEKTSIQRSDAFKAVETTHSASSRAYYGGSVSSSSESTGQGSFTVIANDGINDMIMQRKNKVTTIDFYPDRNKTDFVRTQGLIGVDRTWNSTDQNEIAVTITSEEGPSVEL